MKAMLKQNSLPIFDIKPFLRIMIAVRIMGFP